MIYPQYTVIDVEGNVVDLLADEKEDLEKIKKAVGKNVALGDDQIHIKEIVSTEEMHTHNYTAKVRVVLLKTKHEDESLVEDINFL
jgi:catechol-2,3-dioxygenase